MFLHVTEGNSIIGLELKVQCIRKQGMHTSRMVVVLCQKQFYLLGIYAN